jgi:hypothetical protein
VVEGLISDYKKTSSARPTCEKYTRKIGGLRDYVILIGFFFDVFVVLVAPLEMFKKAAAKTWQTWPSHKGIITTSYENHKSGDRRYAAYWTPEICGTYIDSGERFCANAHPIRWFSIWWRREGSI